MSQRHCLQEDEEALLLPKTSTPAKSRDKEQASPRSGSALMRTAFIFMIVAGSLESVTAFSFQLLTRSSFTQGLASRLAAGFTIPTLTPYRTIDTSNHSNSKTHNNDNSNMPSSIKPYYQLVVDEQGGTSIVLREFTNVHQEGYSNTPQLVEKLDPSFATPTNVIFTSLQGENPFHHCPSPQIVVCLAGKWYIRTTDDKVTEFGPGDVLYQDNTAQHPAARPDTHRAMHFSASVGDEPCDQMIVQLKLANGGPVANSKEAPPPM